MPEPTTITSTDAAAAVIPRLPVRREQNAGGEPSVGSLPITSFGAVEVGIWEMGVGGMYDVEVDEVFIVLRGAADVDVLDASGLVASSTRLRPGVVARLHAGMRTRWTVTETLRKIYLIDDAE